MTAYGDLPAGFDTVHDRIDEEGSAYCHPDFYPTRVETLVDGCSGQIHGPSAKEVLEGSVSGCTPEMFEFTPSSEFTIGGVQSAAIWGDYSLLPGFEDHLRNFDPSALASTLAEQRDGVDVVGDMDPNFVEEVRPTDPKLLRERRTRSLEGHRNSTRLLLRPCRRLQEEECDCFVCFSAKMIMKMLRSGAVRCLGTIDHVRESGAMPSIVSPITLEVNKPRFCLNWYVLQWWYAI
jgi:hypothetical protein